MYTLKVKIVNDKTTGYGKTSSPVEAGKVARKILGVEAQEVFIILFLNTRNEIVGTFEAARGGIDSCGLDIRVIFRAALMAPGCVNIIIAHNHPSGSVEPSSTDIQMTRRLQEVGKMLDINVTDHIIVGYDGKQFSFVEGGLL